MYVSRKLLDISLVSIASSFGKDRSTVMHGIKKIENDIKKVQNLMKKLIT